MSKTAINSRNYNPGNMRNTADAWQGKVGSNGGFVTFSRPEYGTRAMSKQLYKYNERGKGSVREIIETWAPPNENVTEAYVQKVANDMGVSADADLGDLKSQPGVTKQLMKSMTEHEGGSMGVFTDKHFEDGIAMANGKNADELDFSELPEDFNEGLIGTEEVDVTADAEAATDKQLAYKVDDLENRASVNWMSTVDSPQYLWTLYIVNDEVFNDPSILHNNDTGAINSNKAMIVSQQGVTTEYTMDNFAMIATVTPGQAHGNTTPGIIQFDLFETLGFTFLDKTLKAGIRLGKPGSLHEQNYVLRLEYVGRDPTTGGSVRYPGTFFYPIKLNQIRSTTGPEGTRYNIIAFSLIKHAQTEAVSTVDVTVNGIDQVSTFASKLEEAYNLAQVNQLSLAEKDSGVAPDKQIKIVFDRTTTNIRGLQGLPNFNLEVKPWSSTADAAAASGKSIDMDNLDTRAVTLDSQTAMGTFIMNSIQDNVPAWAKYVLEAQEVGRTPNIVVTPTIKYMQSNANIKNQRASQTAAGGPGKYIQSGGRDAYVTPMVITYTIKIHGCDIVANVDPAKHRKNFQDKKWQLQKWKRLPLQKNYQYLYTGVNTEVLNYQIDIEQLYVQVQIPQAGFYHADKSEQFAPTTPTKVTPYIEDIAYDKMPTNFMDLVKYELRPLGIYEQRKAETDGSDTLIAATASKLAKREYDAYGFSLEIKGDPYWMGGSLSPSTDGIPTPDYQSQDALITFLQYNPNADDLLTHQRRGPVDLVSTGVYKLTSIESRFQGGKFTQTLIGFKDTTTNSFLLLPQLVELSGT
jgi:hypothetical protein|tara:strand:- start:1554 stop:3959 length:2406 start_codon:yes stop_codon:yes gene_type:complete